MAVKAVKMPRIAGKGYVLDPRQLSLFYPKSDWVCKDLNSLPDLRHVEAFAIDSETRDPPLIERGSGFNRREPTSYAVGYSIAVDDFCAYLPIDHLGGGNMPKENVFRYLQHILGGNAVKVMHNAQYDLGVLHSSGLEVSGSIADTLVATGLLDERLEGGYSLRNACQVFLNMPGKDEELLKEAALSYGVDPKSGLWQLPAMYVGPYAEHDAAMTFALYIELVDRLSNEGLDRVWELEKKISRLAFLMSLNGVAVDIEKARNLNTSWLSVENAYLSDVNRSFVGHKIDPWSSASIVKALHDLHPGLNIPVTPKGEPSITNEWLEEIQDEVVGALPLADFRKINKMRRDFINGAILDFQVNGRIHSTWHQTKRDEGGTVSGRFASSNPNLQQVPARHPEYGPEIRALFLPNKGELFLSGDYSSQEIRIFLHIAWDLITKGAVPIPDVGGVCSDLIKKYHEDPHTDLHVIVKDLMKIESRSDAKTVNFAILYAAGVGKVAQTLERPIQETRELLARHRNILPFAGAVLDKMIELAQRRGFIRTLLGRRRRFHIGGSLSDKRLGYHKALNTAVQGTAADQAKMAAVLIYEHLGLVPLMQIHDELAYSIQDVDTSIEIKRDMERALPLHIPVIADVHVGKNWAEAKGS